MILHITSRFSKAGVDKRKEKETSVPVFVCASERDPIRAERRTHTAFQAGRR